MSDGEWNPYYGGHRWEHYNDPRDVPSYEHPGPGVPGPWSHGDEFHAAPGVRDAEAQMFQDGVNDAIWRDMTERAIFAPPPPATGDASNYGPTNQLGDVVDGLAAMRADLSHTEWPIPPVTPTPETPPRAKPTTQPSWAIQDEQPTPVFWSPAAPQEANKTEYVYTPPRTKGLWKAIGAVTCVIAAAGVVNVLANQGKTRERPQAPPSEIGFSCDVNGISENPSVGTANLTFSTSVEGKTVQVFAVDSRNTPTLMQNAEPINNSPTEYQFTSNGLHRQHLIVKAGTTVCSGEFTLGSPDAHDEEFLR